MVWPPDLPADVDASLISRLLMCWRHGASCCRLNGKATGRARGFIIGETPADCASFLHRAGAPPRPRPKQVLLRSGGAASESPAYFMFQMNADLTWPCADTVTARVCSLSLYFACTV